MYRITLAGLIVILLALASPMRAIEPPVWSDPRGYVCYRADGPITIDG
jgi:hypothetical protein